MSANTVPMPIMASHEQRPSRQKSASANTNNDATIKVKYPLFG